ncbi:hypothetical protein [Cereibacter azotoformans]|uniref:DUF2188 domain-containing protein n=1 Tax=Cereibacter azotoformans TaxID=43057 RepID=A0A2T5JXT3_9RHOB|nr:hypothetical protein [Cereibacter azotoformans]MBO4169691.1 hypothetical protein [Cereibacter azotoformans]PTR14967.1 hypothetical protein C8J28_115112 [Cereibacter azotoformans]
MAAIRVEELIAPRSRVYWITADGEFVASRETQAEALRFARSYADRTGGELISAAIIPLCRRGSAA